MPTITRLVDEKFIRPENYKFLSSHVYFPHIIISYYGNLYKTLVENALNQRSKTLSCGSKYPVKVIKYIFTAYDNHLLQELL